MLYFKVSPDLLLLLPAESNFGVPFGISVIICLTFLSFTSRSMLTLLFAELKLVLVQKVRFVLP